MLKWIIIVLYIAGVAMNVAYWLGYNGLLSYLSLVAMLIVNIFFNKAFKGAK